VWDVASARGLVAAGFRALGTTSLGVATANGVPDGADATNAEMLRLTRSLVRSLASMPVHLSVDIETGSVDIAVAVAAAGALGAAIGRPWRAASR
jgi:2-methylisocitrate lyase-like PEP mutase family enzyme